MSRCDFRPAAEADLEEIADYVAQNSPASAVALVQRLRKKCQLLAEMPRSAPARPELGPDIRSRPVEGSYTLYYRPIPDGIEVLRVLHGRRDVRLEMLQ